MTVYDDVKAERDRQDAKWGTVEQNPHSSHEWLGILDEEMYEATVEGETYGPNWRTELIHVAAVAIAAVEQYDMEQRKVVRP